MAGWYVLCCFAGMLLSAQGNTGTSVVLSAASSTNLLRRKGLLPWLIAALSLFLWVASSEANDLLDGSKEPVSMLENYSARYSSGSSTLWFITRSQAKESSELSGLIRETEAASLLRWHAEQLELDARDSLRLAPPKLTSALGYLSRMSLFTGFGEFYPNEPLHLSRNNGVGMATPHWFYLKVSFRL